MYQDVFDEILAFAASGAKSSKLAAARRSYEQDTGEIFESDATFEQRIAAFLEWYVLDAPQEDGEPPIVHFARAVPAQWCPEKLAALHAWRGSRLSLFEIRRRVTASAEVTDLLTSSRHSIDPAPQLVGCEAGALVIARMLGDGARVRLTDGVVFLPPGGVKRAKAVAKVLRKTAATPKEQLRLLLRLAFLANRCERYRHVEPKRIFTAPGALDGF